MQAPSGDDATIRRRWPYGGAGQKPLLLAALAVILGSFLPWVNTAFGTYWGYQGAGLWTFYAGVFGVAGAIVRNRNAALAQAVIVGTAAVGLGIWQIAHLSSLGLGGGWFPGVGLVLVLAGGALALRAAWRLYAGR